MSLVIPVPIHDSNFRMNNTVTLTPPGPQKRESPRHRCATIGPHINKSRSTSLLSMEHFAGRSDKKRTRTRESDLFEGASAFDSLTGQNSVLAMTVSEKEQYDPRFTTYIHDKPVKKLPTIEQCADMIYAQMRKVNEEYMAMIDKGKTSKELLRGISYQIIEKKELGVSEVRAAYMPHILCYSERVDYYETQTNRLKSIIDVYAKFYGFLKNGPVKDGFVDIYRFVRENRTKRLNPEVFEKHDQVLVGRIPKSVKMPVPSTTDPVAALRHPSTKSGQMIQRFIKNVDGMYYPDVEVVAEALMEYTKKLSKDDILRLLFDIAWEHRKYPLAPLVQSFKIPDVNDLCPKAFNAPFLSDDLAVMTFNELSASDWPLKTAVDMLFDICVLTNPFDIADAFYKIIEEIGRCAQRCLIRRDQDARNVEIDFDQLFVLMLICIFTSGLSEICAPMQYSSSFREHVMMDTTKVYAMSHMEGLCVHLVTMDYADVRKRSAKIQASRDMDPLGLLKK